jgi:hypothetical protein
MVHAFNTAHGIELSTHAAELSDKVANGVALVHAVCVGHDASEPLEAEVEKKGRLVARSSDPANAGKSLPKQFQRVWGHRLKRETHCDTLFGIFKEYVTSGGYKKKLQAGLEQR